MNAVPNHRLIEANVPRYTSYPTAPHFHAGIDAATVTGWLDTVGEDEAVSLYVHVPFCDRLCWFCACNTRQTLRYEPVAEYLVALYREMELVGGRIGKLARIVSIHLGGGSPTMLRPADLRTLRQRLEANFTLAPDVGLSVEIDPNDMDDARLDALAAIGLTRASLGIQDFDPRVQKAINREQSFETTARVLEGLRARGVGSVNLDLLYGLPFQTVETLSATIEQALSLRPDRLALFGYAHVPWFKKHQTMIDEQALPDLAARLEQALTAAGLIRSAGYLSVGIDHFALPDDSLAMAARDGRLKRNFQGYTDDLCETLIGLGPSSISRFSQGYAQNPPSTGGYRRMVEASGLATTRGRALTEQDHARGWVIERLMCDFSFSVTEMRTRFGATADAVLREAALLTQASPHFSRVGDRFVIGEDGHLLARTIAAHFDAYLASGSARHSSAI
ncbi:oxygen-independent coproporphyrinogen III oxidase [bacterium M00.F.Ca.ET.230.01.1.1]|nr:oxygen-independent coproporphyrinogen III oxidase [bacterium M00.F.Ca.ET.230.01.1.1]